MKKLNNITYVNLIYIHIIFKSLNNIWLLFSCVRRTPSTCTTYIKRLHLKNLYLFPRNPCGGAVHHFYCRSYYFSLFLYCFPPLTPFITFYSFYSSHLSFIHLHTFNHSSQYKSFEAIKFSSSLHSDLRPEWSSRFPQWEQYCWHAI